MTSEQFERWKDFALRMARTCFSSTMRSPSRKWIVARVEEFLDEMEADRARITDWDNEWTELPGSTRHYECVSDRMSDFEWNRLPSSVRALADEDDEDRWEAARDRWFGPVRCCVRAGLDMASEPSAGVAGFTLGDLRRMYTEGLPAWVAGGFHKHGRPVSAETIARAADSTEVWL